jgi:hypothetical protein
MAKAKKAASHRGIGNKVQVVPLADLLEPPVWWQLLCWIGMWFAWAKPQHGGLPECILAVAFMVGQTGLVVLLVTFPTRFPAMQPWEQATTTGLILLAHMLALYHHCNEAKKYGGDPTLPIICGHCSFLLSSYLIYLCFFL